MPGYRVDYDKVFVLPAELTRENMLLNTSRLGMIRMNSLHTNFAELATSGPPSMSDLEDNPNPPHKDKADFVESADAATAVDIV